MNLRASLDLVLEYPFIWQSTLWLLLGLGVSRWFERHPARAHAVLLAALTGAVVSPAVSLLAGRLGWSLLPHRVVEVGGGWTVAPGGVLQASAQRVDMVLYAVSGLMIGVCLLGFVRSLSSARRMLRDCSPVTDPEAIRALALAKQRSSSGYDVKLLERSDIGSPSIWCWSTPVIILLPPRLSSRLSVECLASIFSHELAHLTRRDHRKSLLANVFLAAIGWNPLAWYVRARLGQLAEQACDAAASTSDRGSADYAEALLRLAVGRPPRLGLAIARYGGLSLRIRRILGGQDSRLTIGRRFLGLLAAGVLVSATLLAPVQRAQGVEYQFTNGFRAAPFPIQVEPESNDQVGDLSNPPDCPGGAELVQLDGNSWFCAQGDLSGDAAQLQLSDQFAADGGAFFIRAADDDRPAGTDPADPTNSSKPLRWTTKD